MAVSTTGVALIAVSYEDVLFSVVFGAATVFCLVHFANALSVMLILHDHALEYRVWFKRHRVPVSNISSLTEERWDGGWVLIGDGPKKFRVLTIRLKRSNGEYRTLDFAFMPRKRLNQLVEEIHAVAPQRIKGYKPITLQPHLPLRPLSQSLSD